MKNKNSEQIQTVNVVEMADGDLIGVTSFLDTPEGQLPTAEARGLV